MQVAALQPSATAESGFADLPDDGLHSQNTGPAMNYSGIYEWGDRVEDRVEVLPVPSRDDWPDDVQDSTLTSEERASLLDANDSISYVAEGKARDRIQD